MPNEVYLIVSENDDYHGGTQIHGFNEDCHLAQGIADRMNALARNCDECGEGKPYYMVTECKHLDPSTIG